MDAGSLSWLDDFLKNFGTSKVEQAGNILSRLSPVFGGAAAARNTQENTQIGQLLAQERLKQTGPATRLATGMRASVAKNAQPVTNNFRPGTGQAVKFSGGLTPDALGPDARQLADQVMHQTITNQLAGDTVPQITDSSPIDKALGIGSTIAGIGGALTAKSPQQQIVQSILDRLKPPPPPNYGDVGSTTSVPDPGPSVPETGGLFSPGATYGVDSGAQEMLPGAVDNPAGAMPFTPESGGFDAADYGSDFLGAGGFAEPATTYGIDAATQAALPGAVEMGAGGAAGLGAGIGTEGIGGLEAAMGGMGASDVGGAGVGAATGGGTMAALMPLLGTAGLLGGIAWGLPKLLDKIAPLDPHDEYRPGGKWYVPPGTYEAQRSKMLAENPDDPSLTAWDPKPLPGTSADAEF